jgi:hypothetical protein
VINRTEKHASVLYQLILKSVCLARIWCRTDRTVTGACLYRTACAKPRSQFRHQFAILSTMSRCHFCDSDVHSRTSPSYAPTGALAWGLNGVQNKKRGTRNVTSTARVFLAYNAVQLLPIAVIRSQKQNQGIVWFHRVVYSIHGWQFNRLTARITTTDPRTCRCIRVRRRRQISRDRVLMCR